MSLSFAEIQDFPEATTRSAYIDEGFTGTYKRVFYVPDSTASETPFHRPWARYIVGMVSSTHSGTLHVDQSNDGVTTHFTENFPVGESGLSDYAPIVTVSTEGVGFLRRLFAPYVRVRFAIPEDVAMTGIPIFSLFSLLIGPDTGLATAVIL